MGSSHTGFDPLPDWQSGGSNPHRAQAQHGWGRVALFGLWPGEATLLAAAVLWVLVLLYVGVGEWRRMVNDARTDVGEIGER